MRLDSSRLGSPVRSAVLETSPETGKRVDRGSLQRRLVLAAGILSWWQRESFPQGEKDVNLRLAARLLHNPRPRVSSGHVEDRRRRNELPGDFGGQRP